MAASAVTVVGLATTTTVAAQATRTATTLNLKTLSSGTTYTFYGALGVGPAQSPRIPNATITLQVSSNNKNWTNAWAPTTTNASGLYAFHLTLKPNTYYFRTYYAGNTTYSNTFSNVVTVSLTKLATTLTIHVTNTGSAYTFYGALGNSPNVSPRIKGATITLQVSADKVRWSTAWAPTTTNSAGDYVFHLPLVPGHSYYFRTYYAGNSTYLEAYSPVVQVTAA
jgi:hypothetical protein